jgi:hypothetical protein
MEAVAYARANGWKVINGNTLQRKWTVVTPEIHRSKGPGDTFGTWGDDTYDRLLSVSIVGRADGTGKTSVIKREHRTPWKEAHQTSVSIREAIFTLTRSYDHEGNPN